MACGLPVIATGQGGQADYFCAEIGYPLRVTDGGEPDSIHLQELLRYVYEHRQEARQKGLAASEAILAAWTWRHAAQRIKNRLIEIEP